MSERKQFLFLVVDRFLTVHEAWAQDQEIHWITDEYEQACDNMIELFAHGDLPGECRQLAAQVAALGREWSAFRDRVLATGDSKALPGQSFGKVVSLLSEARQAAKPRNIPSLESIKDLKEQKVSDAQICVIYEWVDDNGPQLWKLREELAEPGKHTKDYIPPSHQRRLNRPLREKEIIEATARAFDTKLNRAKAAVAPESIETLIGQGLSASQIAGMKDCSVGDVFAEADRLGLERPATSYDLKGAAHDRKPSESEQRVLDQLGKGPRTAPPAPAGGQDDDEDAGDGVEGAMSLEDEVIQYHLAGGKSAAEIAALVTSEGFEVSRQKVQAIIQRYQADPTAFEKVSAGT